MFLQGGRGKDWRERYLERRAFLKGMMSLGALAFLSSVAPACLRENKQVSSAAFPAAPSEVLLAPEVSTPVIESAEPVITRLRDPLAILYRDEVNEYRFGIKRIYRGTRFESFMKFLRETLPESDNYRILEAETASDEDLRLIVSQEYIDFTREYFKAMNLGLTYPGDFSKFHSEENRTTENPGKVEEAARLFVGQAKTACDLVQEGRFKKAVSIGGGWHHAKRDYGDAYCIYNDVAFAALYLIEKYGLERVLILDTDAHAGNGTSAYFYDDPRVLFIDLHQDHRTIYPRTGYVHEIGSGAGMGFNINIPMPVGAGYDSYRFAFETVVEPVVAEYKPQVIIRNGGSDPFKGDRLCELGLPISGFKMIGDKVRKMAEVCDGKVVDLINSGYNRKYLPYAWMALLTGLGDIELSPETLASFSEAGADFVQDIGGTIEGALILASTEEVIKELKEYLKDYWSCFGSYF